MRIKDIIRTIQDNFLLAFILVAVLAVFLAVGYLIVYKKLLKGDKSLSKSKTFIWFCFVGYIIMVIGVTFLNRGPRIFGDTNLHLFSSYREAWNSFNSTTWRFIILNILMLIPFGILLPLLNKNFRRFMWTLGAAFLLTLTIETLQLITGYGIFEIDDIFNNVLGATIGYGIVMTVISIVEDRKNKLRLSVAYLSPLILVIISYISIVAIYDSQEFGNLYIAYNYKINMRDIELSLNTEIKNEGQEVFLNDNKYNISKVPIYKAPIYDEESGKQFFIDFLKDKDIQTEIEVDPYDDMAIYWSRGEPSYNMWFDYIGGTYSYTDFSSLHGQVQKSDADQESILKELAKLNITVPEAAIFSKVEDDDEKGVFQWSIENHVDGEYITNGNLRAEYYSDKTIRNINNNIIKYEKLKNISIKSKEEAYKDLEEGKFNRYKADKIKKIEVEDINISYMLDSKGFYQPIYKFSVKIDGEDESIDIPAK